MNRQIALGGMLSHTHTHICTRTRRCIPPMPLQEKIHGCITSWEAVPYSTDYFGKLVCASFPKSFTFAINYIDIKRFPSGWTMHAECTFLQKQGSLKVGWDKKGFVMSWASSKSKEGPEESDLFTYSLCYFSHAHTHSKVFQEALLPVMSLL